MLNVVSTQNISHKKYINFHYTLTGKREPPLHNHRVEGVSNVHSLKQVYPTVAVFANIAYTP